MSIADFSHDPDLIALVQAQLDAVYSDDTYYVRPDPADVIADALAVVRADTRDRAGDQASCHKVDECTATAIVLNRFADWIEGEL